MEYSTDIEGMEITVEYNYETGEDVVHTEPNGDPGTPGYPATVEITAVFTTLLNMSDEYIPINIMSILELDSSYIEKIEEEILESHER